MREVFIPGILNPALLVTGKTNKGTLERTKNEQEMNLKA